MFLNDSLQIWDRCPKEQNMQFTLSESDVTFRWLVRKIDVLFTLNFSKDQRKFLLSLSVNGNLHSGGRATKEWDPLSKRTELQLPLKQFRNSFSDTDVYKFTSRFVNGGVAKYSASDWLSVISWMMHLDQIFCPFLCLNNITAHSD